MIRRLVTIARQRHVDMEAASAATAAYWAADEAARIPHTQLEREVDPHQRAILLRQLAEHEIAMARLHFAAFGPYPDPDDRLDMADSLAMSAHLLQLLRQVEWAVACGRERLRDGTPLGDLAGGVLDRMAGTPDLPARMRLLEDLYDVVEPIVGGQAAETVACLPAPDMVGWQTLDEHEYGAEIAAARSLK